MSSLSCVPCIQICSKNLSDWWKPLIDCIKTSDFVALDLEFSGLGDRTKLNAKKIDERYAGVVEAAKTRSVLSIGFAFFNFSDINSKDNICDNSFVLNANKVDINQTSVESKTDSCDQQLSNPFEDNNRFEALVRQLAEELESENNVCTENKSNVCKKQWNFSSNVFNILCLCEDDYVCEPETMRFLAGHGFDFNSQCLHGLSYHRGNDTDSDDITKPSLRNLISEIVKQKLRIVLHNGFIDLIFLYQNFYAELPNDLQTFVSDLVELFPAGVFDTKYIADFHERLNRSYLEYLFYERQRYNIERSIKGQVCIEFSFPVYSENSLDIEFKDLSTNILSESDLSIDICYEYANHGWCRRNQSCGRSHNIDHILDQKRNKTKKLKKMIKKMERKTEEQSSDNSNGTDISLIDSNIIKQTKQGVHRAGYDAFMTGYCLAFYLAVNSKPHLQPKQALNIKSLSVSQIVNNIYLTGKDQSLRITASSFAKTSTNHKNKILSLRSDNKPILSPNELKNSFFG